MILSSNGLVASEQNDFNVRKDIQYERSQLRGGRSTRTFHCLIKINISVVYTDFGFNTFQKLDFIYI